MTTARNPTLSRKAKYAGRHHEQDHDFPSSVCAWDSGSHRSACPATDLLSKQGLFFSHTLLMGGRRDVEQVAEAIARIHKYAEEIARLGRA